MTERAAALQSMAEGSTARSESHLAIYVVQGCSNCAYAVEVAGRIRERYPQVRVDVIDMATATEPALDVVFATPTYLLNGRVWSLGNPSDQKMEEEFGRQDG